MMRLAIILALACVATEARGQDIDLITPFPIGSICPPSHTREDGTFAAPVCTVLKYAPIGTRFKKDFHEDLPWYNRLKADRLVPLRTQTTEAAPK